MQLVAANVAKDAVASGVAASDLELALASARKLASLQTQDPEMQRLVSKLAAFEQRAGAPLAQAFKPSDKTVREMVVGGGRAAYDAEATSWREDKAGTVRAAESTPPTLADPSWTDDAIVEAKGIVDGTPSEAHKVKFDIGKGSLTGAVTLSVETGTSAIALGTDQLKALKSTMSIKVNDFSVKLETAVLSGKVFDLELVDGVKLSFDVSGLKASSDAKKLELLAIAVKLQGDVTHWMQAPPGIKITLDGQIQFSMGAALAEELGAFVVANVHERAIAKELEDVTLRVEEHAAKVKELEKQLAATETTATRAELRELEHQIFEHKLQISTGGRQLERITHELGTAEKQAVSMLAKLKGKPAKLVGSLMRRKTVVWLGKKLARIVPVLNVIGYIINIKDLVSFIRNLRENGFVIGDMPGDEAGKVGPPRGSHDAGKATVEGEQPSGGSSKIESHTAGGSERASAPALNASGPARQILDSIRTSAGTQALSPEQLAMIGMIVPADLKPSEVQQVIAAIHAGSGQIATGGQVIGAIGEAVRDVRRGTVSPTSTSSSDAVSSGPVTSPNQIDAKADPATVVSSAPASIVSTWFQERTGQLVLTPAGEAWQAANVGKLSVEGRTLRGMSFVVTETGDGGWDLRLTFSLESGRIAHAFFASRAGVQLVLEPYVLLQ